MTPAEADRLAITTAERDRARAIAVSLEQRLTALAYEYAETVDGEVGCCHSAEDLRRGGREPAWDGDDFEPLPTYCSGLATLRTALGEADQ